VISQSKPRAEARFAPSILAAGFVLLAGCDAEAPRNRGVDQPSMTADSAAVEDPKQVIIGLEREWATALNQKDLKWFQRNLSPTYQTVLGNGRILSRSEVIEHMQRAPPAQGLKLDQADVRVLGNAAVATTTQSFTRRDGRTAQLRVTDVWARSDSGRWIAVHTHESMFNDVQ
jgi:ketosteroid isomerase-like protein